MSAELLNCPFCGAVAEEHHVTDYNDTTVIECQNEDCGARNMHDNAILARRAWNRRHTWEHVNMRKCVREVIDNSYVFWVEDQLIALLNDRSPAQQPATPQVPPDGHDLNCQC